MNDPHIEALHYSVRHAEGVDYDNASPLSHDTPGFTVKIENDRAEITMKSHHATVQAARAEVEPFLGAWELTAALQFRPGDFELAYDRATIIDRDPTPGGISFAALGDALAAADVVKAHVKRSKYPDPPNLAIVRDAVVDLMFDRYRRYRAGGTTLSDAANFCLTVLASDAGGRKSAAARYSIAKTVLDKLGALVANKGGREARKAGGTGADFTPAERQWLEEAMKRLILRAGEVAAGNLTSLPQITMACLPPIYLLPAPIAAP